MRALYAKVKSDMISTSRITCMRPLSKEDESQGCCTNCGTEMFFQPPKFEEIEELACSLECERELGWWKPKPQLLKNPDLPIVNSLESEKPKKSKICPTCGGYKTRGGGYKHSEDCVASPVNIKAAKAKIRNAKVCPGCGGPSGRGRGFKHKLNCSIIAEKLAKNKQKAEEKKSKKVREPCPKCGGLPGRAQGYKHTEECPDSAKNKLALKLAQKRKHCPECGGLALKGRNRFEHAQNCSVK